MILTGEPGAGKTCVLRQITHPACAATPGRIEGERHGRGDEIDSKVLNWVHGKLGQQVGRGECWNLIDRALRAAGARSSTTTGRDDDHFAEGAYASEDALVPIVRELIKRGAVIDARTSAGKTPLQLAVWRTQLKIARLLVVAGASLDMRDGQRKSAADELVDEGRQAELDELRRLVPERGSQAWPDSSRSRSRN